MFLNWVWEKRVFFLYFLLIFLSTLILIYTYILYIICNSNLYVIPIFMPNFLISLFNIPIINFLIMHKVESILLLSPWFFLDNLSPIGTECSVPIKTGHLKDKKELVRWRIDDRAAVTCWEIGQSEVKCELYVYIYLNLWCKVGSDHLHIFVINKRNYFRKKREREKEKRQGVKL